jgi:tRNA(fMet)-specific endonuclease VapC
MGLMLDSSVLIAAERGRLDLVRMRAALNEESSCIAAITLSELWHGCHRGAGKALEGRLVFVRNIEALLPVLEFSRTEALIHAKLWADLEQAGKRIGNHDMIIAATAISHGHALATLNESEFGRIKELKVIAATRFLVR